MDTADEILNDTRSGYGKDDPFGPPPAQIGTSGITALALRIQASSGPCTARRSTPEMPAQTARNNGGCVARAAVDGKPASRKLAR